MKYWSVFFQGLVATAISLPQAALAVAMASEAHEDADDKRGAVTPGLDTLHHEALLAQLANHARGPLGREPHLQRARPHIDPLDQELVATRRSQPYDL